MHPHTQHPYTQHPLLIHQAEDSDIHLTYSYNNRIAPLRWRFDNGTAE